MFREGRAGVLCRRVPPVPPAGNGLPRDRGLDPEQMGRKADEETTRGADNAALAHASCVPSCGAGPRRFTPALPKAKQSARALALHPHRCGPAPPPSPSDSLKKEQLHCFYLPDSLSPTWSCICPSSPTWPYLLSLPEL